MVDWVTFTYSVSRRTAHEWVEAARALKDLPHLAAAYGDGTLSWDKTRAVAVVATPETDAALTAEARDTDAMRLESAARRAKGVSLHEAQRRHQARFFAMRRSRTEGGVKLSGYLPDVDGEILIKAIELLAEDVPKDPDTGLYPPIDVRCADALVELAAGQLGTEQRDHGERALVVAHVDVTPAGSHPHDTPVYELESEIVIAPETADRLMCDAVIKPVFENEGQRVGDGRRSRPVTPRLRRQIKERDRFCRFPGCTRMRVTDCHHMVHRSKGGPTEPDNLALLCRFHHRKMHEGGWTMRGDPDDVVEFVKPNGEVLISEMPKLSDDLRQRALARLLP
jgi:hypothetical protein